MTRTRRDDDVRRDDGRRRRRLCATPFSGVAAALAAVALTTATVTVEGKNKLNIVNSPQDIAHVSHILCGTGMSGRNKCHDYVEMLTPFVDAASTLERAFAELARRYSECPTGAEGGDLGYFPRGEMAKDFEKVVFDSSTPVDEVVGPLETKNGWHVVLIHDRHLADEEAKEKARVKEEQLRVERLERAEKQRAYQEERERRKAERLGRVHERDEHRHSLHAEASAHQHFSHDEL